MHGMEKIMTMNVCVCIYIVVTYFWGEELMIDGHIDFFYHASNLKSVTILLDT